MDYVILVPSNRKRLLEMEIFETIYLEPKTWKYNCVKAEANRLKREGLGRWKVSGKHDPRIQVTRFK